jgi:glutathione S-transferase
MSNYSEHTYTLHFQQALRSIRIAWVMESKYFDYNLVFYDRENILASASCKNHTGVTLGKAPALVVQRKNKPTLVSTESGAITQYLTEIYVESL